MRIVHISDSHISLDNPQRTENLQTCVDVINSADVQPNAVIHTGDLTHNGVAEEYNITRAVLDGLKAPYFVLPGNKDKRPAFIDAFLDEKSMQVNDGFVQYSIEKFPVRLIMLDTLSENSNKGLLGDARLAHIKRMLDADVSKPIAIFMHHTPFEVAAIPDPFQFEDWLDVENLQNMLAQYPQIMGIYCGHIHRSIDGMLGALKVNAISCMASDLRKGRIRKRSA